MYLRRVHTNRQPTYYSTYIDTDYTEATKSAQGELKMLKEALIGMEKELQDRDNAQFEIASKKANAVEDLKESIKSNYERGYGRAGCEQE